MNKNVVIEFFDDEPLDNIITCLNYALDKVIYIGYENVMNESNISAATRTLNKLCGIEDIKCIAVSTQRLDGIIETIEQIIINEKNDGNNCYIDLTGGESLILVALGIVSDRCNIPMHIYDIMSNKINTLKFMRDEKDITTQVRKRECNITIDDIIHLYGGAVNYFKQKNNRIDDGDAGRELMIEKLLDIDMVNPGKWNSLTGLINKVMKKCDYDNTRIVRIYKSDYVNLYNTDELYSYLVNISSTGCITNLVESKSGEIKFRFKNDWTRNLLTDSGLVLEFHTYFKVKNSGEYDECLIGVHIDWDGVINGCGNETGVYDVENEIDVVARKGYMLSLISCKNGKFDKSALYELETVASRFGGKYTEKCIALSQYINETDKNRAKEMGIRIISE